MTVAVSDVLISYVLCSTAEYRTQEHIRGQCICVLYCYNQNRVGYDL